MSKVVNQPKTSWEELVIDLKAVETTITKNTIGSAQCPQSLPAQEGTCTGPSLPVNI